MYAIRNYEGFYSICQNGIVYSHERKIKAGYGSVRTIKDRILKHKIDSKGYPTVTLYKGGKRQFRHHRIHRLIMENIYPIDTMDKMDVNHKDGNKLNYSIDNLEWVTRSQNNQHAHDNKLNNSPNSIIQKKAASMTCIKLRKLTFEQANEAREMYRNGKSQNCVAKLFNVSRATIGLIVNNKTYQIKGSKYEHI